MNGFHRVSVVSRISIDFARRKKTGVPGLARLQMKLKDRDKIMRCDLGCPGLACLARSSHPQAPCIYMHVMRPIPSDCMYAAGCGCRGDGIELRQVKSAVYGRQSRGIMMMERGVDWMDGQSDPYISRSSFRLAIPGQPIWMQCGKDTTMTTTRTGLQRLDPSLPTHEHVQYIQIYTVLLRICEPESSIQQEAVLHIQELRRNSPLRLQQQRKIVSTTKENAPCYKCKGPRGYSDPKRMDRRGKEEQKVKLTQ